MTTKEWLQTEHLLNTMRKMAIIRRRGRLSVEEIAKRNKLEIASKLPLELQQELSDRNLNRRYRVKDAAQMIGVSSKTIYAAEEDGRLHTPDFRSDTLNKTRLGYTINQINHMRAVFKTLPTRPPGTRGIISGMLNQKGGSTKTTSTLLYAQYLAIKGYRVLVVDTDGQGSVSFALGKKPNIDIWRRHTITPYMLMDDGDVELDGEDGVLEEGESENLRYAVQKTYWDNIDVIPACMENLQIDMAMQSVFSENEISSIDIVQHLRYGLLDLANDYDFILLDGTPSLNILTLNVIAACDLVFTPVPASMFDFTSSVEFAAMVETAIHTYTNQQISPNTPFFQFFISKFSESDYAKSMAGIIRAVFNVESGDCLTAELHQSDEIGKAGNTGMSVYEVNPSESNNRVKLKETIQMIDTLFSEIFQRSGAIMWGYESNADLGEKIMSFVQTEEAMQEAQESLYEPQVPNDDLH